MPTKIFVNLPMAELPRSIAFYKAFGFTQNLKFSDNTAACMVISDENYLMLLTHEKFKSFSNAAIPDAHKATGLMVAVECKNREEVDSKAGAALAQGGSEPRPPVDMGLMYNRTISDPDGHRLEPFFMDMAAMPQS